MYVDIDVDRLWENKLDTEEMWCNTIGVSMKMQRGGKDINGHGIFEVKEDTNLSSPGWEELQKEDTCRTSRPKWEENKSRFGLIWYCLVNMCSAYEFFCFVQVSSVSAGPSQEIFSFSVGGSGDNLLAAGSKSQVWNHFGLGFDHCEYVTLSFLQGYKFARNLCVGDYCFVLFSVQCEIISCKEDRKSWHRLNLVAL